MIRHRFLGLIAYYLTSLLHKTLRIKFDKHFEYDPSKQYLFAFWHGKQLMPVLQLVYHKTPKAALVSASKDGDMLEVWLKKLGYKVIRGSSRKNNISALSQMIRILKKGYTVGFGIDGPIGPIYKVKPGMTHMAQKLGIEIVPVGSAFSNKWVMKKAWDQYEIPKPFSKAAYYLGKPMVVDSSADLEHYNLMLEERIHEAEIEASSLLRKNS